MKTLEQVKKDKNWLAYRKGYPQDPEGYTFKFLTKRFLDELKELFEVIELDEHTDEIESILPEPQWVYNDKIIDELGDISNIIDYIATKIVTNYLTKYGDDKC